MSTDADTSDPGSPHGAWTGDGIKEFTTKAVEIGRQTAEAAARLSRRKPVAAALLLAAAPVLAACGSTGTSQPASASELTRLGQGQQAEQHVLAAATDYRAALAQNPSYLPALLGLAELATPSVPVEAAALLDQAVTIAPADAEAHRLLGKVLISMGEKRAGRNQLLVAARLGTGPGS
jgi:tetratricopeptide (TPR) repeat protein